MKYLTLMIILYTNFVNAEECKTSRFYNKEEVVHTVDTKMPNALKDAIITVSLANGKTYTFKSKDFMVVPRKQVTVVGENSTAIVTKTCNYKNKKNLLLGELRKDFTGLDSEVTTDSAKVNSNKNLIPGVNYYRRQVLEDVGVGAGVDTNGTLKGIIGLEF